MGYRFFAWQLGKTAAHNMVWGCVSKMRYWFGIHNHEAYPVGPTWEKHLWAIWIVLSRLCPPINHKVEIGSTIKAQKMTSLIESLGFGVALRNVQKAAGLQKSPIKPIFLSRAKSRCGGTYPQMNITLPKSGSSHFPCTNGALLAQVENDVRAGEQ